MTRAEAVLAVMEALLLVSRGSGSKFGKSDVTLFAIPGVEGRPLRLGQRPAVLKAGYQIGLAMKGPAETNQIDPTGLQGRLSRAAGKSSGPDQRSLECLTRFRTRSSLRCVSLNSLSCRVALRLQLVDQMKIGDLAAAQFVS